MADRLTIARPYAKAAFATARADNRLAAWSDLLSATAQAVVDERVRPLIGSPRVTPAQLTQLLCDVAGAGLDDNGRRFVAVLADNRRLGYLPEIARLFAAYKDEAEGVIDVTVTAAAEVAPAEQAALTASLEKRFGRRVRLQTAVDASLLGGAVVRAGDLVIDGSIKSRLERMAYELTA
jgi:F-type H+-transporting ATPase subunit delta